MSPEVRVELRPLESMSDEIKPFVKMFLCGVVGVVLRPRGPADPHISFEIISEDDGYWFPYSGAGTSSAWLDSYIAALTAARSWCEREAIPDMFGDQQYGWNFKGEKP